ncbi:FAD-binding oxidoreductase [Candidatus Saccharibacteria bacterium]|nr:FAD-binding oxidoreductase [Candidatus Saccharibacteria bacterium]
MSSQSPHGEVACAIIEKKHTKEDGDMNKIAVYLNEHLLGEVTSSKAMRRRYSRDGSVLSVTPEIIAFPRITNDIRKVARFAWQLAEKGHPMGITIRGRGGDVTGAAIGKGLVMSTSTHLNNIITVMQKDRLVHVQPGVSFEKLSAALSWQGLAVANMPNDLSSTVAAAIANNDLGESGDFASAVEKLEVVLANGDLIETSRINKHELNKKLGLQTFEGEIYRKLEGLIEDNEEVLKHLAADPVRDSAGYKNLSRVKAKDGSFDLTPLFIGSQGTLGFISEIVLKADFYSRDRTIAVAVVEDPGLARDITDRLTELQPSALKTIDGELFRRAAKLGARAGLLGSTESIGTVIYVEFNDFSDRAQLNKLKKMRKLLSKLSVGMIDSSDHQPEEFDAVRTIASSLRVAENDDSVAVPIIDGACIANGRWEEFTAAVSELSDRHHVALPMETNVLTGTIDVFPVLKLDVISDKQKLFRLISDYAALVTKCGGAFVSNGSEGRLKANTAWAQLEEAEVLLYEQLRAIFDPFGTMNPDVKQKNDVRHLVASLRTTYDVTDFVA